MASSYVEHEEEEDDDDRETGEQQVWEAVVESLQNLKLSHQEEKQVMKGMVGSPSSANSPLSPAHASSGAPARRSASLPNLLNPSMLGSRGMAAAAAAAAAAAVSSKGVGLTLRKEEPAASLRQLWDPMADTVFNAQPAAARSSRRRSSSVVEMTPLEAPLGGVSPHMHPYPADHDRRFQRAVNLILQRMSTITSAFPAARWVTPRWNDSTKEFEVLVLQNRALALTAATQRAAAASEAASAGAARAVSATTAAAAAAARRQIRTTGVVAMSSSSGGPGGVSFPEMKHSSDQVLSNTTAAATAARPTAIGTPVAAAAPSTGFIAGAATTSMPGQLSQAHAAGVNVNLASPAAAAAATALRPLAPALLPLTAPTMIQGYPLRSVMCDGDIGLPVLEDMSSEDVEDIQDSWRLIMAGQTNAYISYKRMMELLQSYKDKGTSTSTSTSTSSEPKVGSGTGGSGGGKTRPQERFSPRRFFYSIFYTRFFEMMPGVRWTFKSSLHQHGQTLLKSLDSVVYLLTLRHSSTAFDEALRLLATTHDIARTVSASHFAAFAAALEHTVQSTLGDQRTPAVCAAWQRLVQLMASKLIDASGAVDVLEPSRYKLPTSLIAHQRRSSAAAAGSRPAPLRAHIVERSSNSDGDRGQRQHRSRSPSSHVRSSHVRKQSDYSPSSSLRRERERSGTRSRARSRSPSSSVRPVLFQNDDASEDSLTPEELEEVEEDDDEEELTSSHGDHTMR